jgi:hypothetical protein
MTRVAILAEPTDNGGVSYRAVAGDRQSVGRTAGEALDALTVQLPDQEAGTLVVIQCLRPDDLFDARQQQRLSELMSRWRAARDQGQALPSEEQAELDTLVEAELRASADRAGQLVKELTR